MPGIEVRLRAATESDFPALLAWRKDPQTEEQLMFTATVDSLEGVRDWVDRRTRGGEFRLIARADDDRPIGFVQLTAIHRANGHAGLGLFVEPSARGTGAAASALSLMEALAADDQRLRKLVIEVLASNPRALRFWAQRGYRTVGTLRSHYARGGTFHDVEQLEKMIRP